MHRRCARGIRGIDASSSHLVAIGTSVRGVSLLRQIAPIDREVESSRRYLRCVAPIDRGVESCGRRGYCCNAPIGPVAESSGCRVIDGANSTAIDRVVVRQYCSSGVVVDIALHILFVVVRQFVVFVRQVVVCVEKGKRENGRKANTVAEASGDAARTSGVLRTDDTVECLHRVGATKALARVTTVAWPPCLGAGTVA